jgi:hypothetical protein
VVAVQKGFDGQLDNFLGQFSADLTSWFLPVLCVVPSSDAVLQNTLDSGAK